MAKAGGSAVQAMEDKTFFHDIEVLAINAMKKDVENAIFRARKKLRQHLSPPAH
jgi:hypothetical protein